MPGGHSFPYPPGRPKDVEDLLRVARWAGDRLDWLLYHAVTHVPALFAGLAFLNAAAAAVALTTGHPVAAGCSLGVAAASAASAAACRTWLT